MDIYNHYLVVWVAGPDFKWEDLPRSGVEVSSSIGFIPPSMRLFSLTSLYLYWTMRYEALMVLVCVQAGEEWVSRSTSKAVVDRLYALAADGNEKVRHPPQALGSLLAICWGGQASGDEEIVGLGTNAMLINAVRDGEQGEKLAPLPRLWPNLVVRALSARHYDFGAASEFYDDEMKVRDEASMVRVPGESPDKLKWVDHRVVFD